ncbi:FCD domain-containing protein [Bauldia sp.]|uniref:FCD domain-containing protein n=1 Tax=Bauldia sp. TaxID=2575872 RepID=UPI003BAA69A3
MNLQTTSHQIAEALAADVRGGVLAPGEMFPSERDLCERFGVGRNVVRGAIGNLQAMGLIEQQHGHRPRVAAPNLSSVVLGVRDAARFFLAGTEGRAHLEQARLFLETSLVRHAVHHATNAHVARMIEAIEECDVSISDSDAFRNADVRFHRVLAEIPGNPIFVALHEAFVERLMKERTLPSNFDSYIRRSNEEHKQIASAILDKDADRAEAIMTEHLARNFASHFRDALAGSEAP